MHHFGPWPGPRSSWLPGPGPCYRNRSELGEGRGLLSQGTFLTQVLCRKGSAAPLPAQALPASQSTPHQYVWCFPEPFVGLSGHARPPPSGLFLFLGHSPELSPLSLPSPSTPACYSAFLCCFRQEVCLTSTAQARRLILPDGNFLPEEPPRKELLLALPHKSPVSSRYGRDFYRTAEGGL